MTLKHTPKSRQQWNQKNWFEEIDRAPFWSPTRKFFGAVIVLSVLFIGWLIYLNRDLPSFEQLESINPELATKVYSADGVLIKEFYTQKRSYTPLAQIPDRMIHAVLAAEDHRFYKHWGIVPIRIISVMITDLLTMSKQQGASTLTQQLARRLYLTPQKTITRKIREWLTAIQLERTYTKNEVLEMYLNLMQFAYGTYGIESAARQYLDKTLDELTIAECAFFAGMVQRSGYFNPYTHLDRALRRKNLVLARMLEEGVIDQQEFAQASSEEISIVSRIHAEEAEIAPYFTEQIRQDLQKKYGWDLYKGGMRIYTTLDSRVQACAEKAVADFLPELQKTVDARMRRRKNFSSIVPPSLLQKYTFEKLLTQKEIVDSLINEKCRVQAALVAIDPRNGHILAMIGGRDFEESQFNRAVQSRRQPGSVFKPIVYAAAVDNGYMPYYEKLNQPIVVQMADGTRWTPHNYDGSIGGLTTLRNALQRSLNLVTARLVQEDIPPQTVVKYAQYLGITSPLDAVDAIALGACGIIPIEIISAFGVFANKGILIKPFSVLRVEDKYGNVLEKNSPQSKGVLREETAYVVADLLQTVAHHGTGAASVSVYQFHRPAGGKTGTTNNFTDAWYVTFTPQIVAGVWVGLDDPLLSLGEGQSGARAALPIAVPFFKAAHDTLHLPVENFVRPDAVIDVEICRDTHELATAYCPDVIKEICISEYMPKTECHKHTGEQDERDSRTRAGQQRRIRY